MQVDAALLPQRENNKQDAPRGRWLHVVSHLHPRYGGLSAVVPQLASRLSTEQGFEVKLDAFCREGEHYAPAIEHAIPLCFWPVNRRRWLTKRDLTARFRDHAANADALHIHGLWEQSTFIAARIAQSLRKPYIVSAHGMLEPWALGRSHARKLLYAALFERRTTQRAACLHALTEAEAHSYRRFGSRTPIAVIPNAVEVPLHLDAAPFLQAFPSLRGKRIVLFLGRLHPKKGVALLLAAWAAIALRWPEAVLVLAGPPDQTVDYAQKPLAAPLLRDNSLVFTGLLDSAMKWSALAAAECFVLPSYSEGQSVATLEAMAAGLPVIVTAQCNMPEVARSGCGWEIRTDAGELSSALQTFLQSTPQANRQMGSRGAALVERCFSWPIVSAQVAELYDWVQGGTIPTTFDLQQPCNSSDQTP